MARTTKQSNTSIADIVSDLEQQPAPKPAARKKASPAAATTVSGRRRTTKAPIKTSTGNGNGSTADVAGTDITVNTADLWIGADIVDGLQSPGAARFYSSPESRAKFGFPEPLFTLRSGPVYSKHAILAWWAVYSNKGQRKREEQLAAARELVARLEAEQQNEASAN